MSVLKWTCKFCYSLLQNYYRHSFLSHCQSVGMGLLVKGPYGVRNAGRIEVGESCMIDSSKERPVRLDVGNRAILKIGNGVYLNEEVRIVCNIAVAP